MIVFTRYMLIAWQIREEATPKTFSSLFYVLFEDVKRYGLSDFPLVIIYLCFKRLIAKWWFSSRLFQMSP